MHGYARPNSVEGLARDTACRAARQIGESGPPRSPDVRKGSPRGSSGRVRWGLWRLDPDCLLRRHEDPQDRVDQDLAAGDDQEQQHEEDSRGPRCDAEAPAESGAYAAQDPPLPRSDQTLPGEALVDVVHGWCTCLLYTSD